MSRPLGSKNRSKFILVTLDEINQKFNKNATIRIDAAYQPLFESIKATEPSDPVVIVPPLNETEAGKQDQIQMTVS